MIPFIQSTWSNQIHRDRVEWWRLELGGGVQEELLFTGYRVSVLQDEKTSVDGWWWRFHNNINILNPIKCTLKNGYGGKCYVYFTTMKNVGGGRGVQDLEAHTVKIVLGIRLSHSTCVGEEEEEEASRLGVVVGTLLVCREAWPPSTKESREPCLCHSVHYSPVHRHLLF